MVATVSVFQRAVGVGLGSTLPLRLPLTHLRFINEVCCLKTISFSAHTQALPASLLPVREGMRLNFFLADEAIDHCTQQCSGYGGKPEKPELCDSPIADKDRHPGAPGGIYGGVGDGDADQMDQG